MTHYWNSHPSIKGFHFCENFLATFSFEGLTSCPTIWLFFKFTCQAVNVRWTSRSICHLIVKKLFFINFFWYRWIILPNVPLPWPEESRHLPTISSLHYRSFQSPPACYGTLVVPPSLPLLSRNMNKLNHQHHTGDLACLPYHPIPLSSTELGWGWEICPQWQEMELCEVVYHFQYSRCVSLNLVPLQLSVKKNTFHK